MGICNFALEQSVHKQKNLDIILKLFESRDKLTNEDIRAHLNVTRRSVVRYTDELERQGRIRQIGDVGRFVVYTLA